MPNIKPVSELRNYGNILKDVSKDNPVLLTRNGYGAYALLDINDYNEYLRMKAEAKLVAELNASFERGEKEGWVDNEEVFKMVREYINGKD